MTPLRAIIKAQLRHPHGALGRVVAASMNIANRSLNRATLEALALRPDERVIEIGFGGGVGVALALETGAEVIAVDPSPDMVLAGRRRFAHSATIRAGSAADTGEPPASLDAAFAVNSVYFWPDLSAGLASLHTVLRSGGRLALGVEPRVLASRASSHEGLPSIPEGLADVLTSAGFDGASVHRVSSRQAVVTAVRM